MREAGDPERAFTTAGLAAEFRVSRNHRAKVIPAHAAASHLKTQRGGGAMPARPPDNIRPGDVVALPEVDQGACGVRRGRANACTLTLHCRLQARLAHVAAAFVADPDAGTLADCPYRPEAA